MRTPLTIAAIVVLATMAVWAELRPRLCEIGLQETADPIADLIEKEAGSAFDAEIIGPPMLEL